MSLNSFLEKTDVRARFRQEFPKPRWVGNQTLLAPPLTKNYQLVGTALKLGLERDDFNQLMGYYALSRIEEADGAPSGHEIKRLGIYFSRSAYLFVFNVADVVNPATFPQFLQWFHERVAIKDY